MALITNILIKTGLLGRSKRTSPSDEEAPPLVVHVEDLSPESLASLEADGLVYLEDGHIEELEGTQPSHATRIVRLDALMANAALAAREKRAETDLAETLGLKATLDDVLAASHLQTSGNAWNIDRALRWLKANRASASNLQELSMRLKAALDQGDISESRVLADAALRDKAVDTYEAALKKRVLAETDTLRKQRVKHEDRITALEQEVHLIQTQEATLRDGLSEWCNKKAAKEAQWAEVVNLLIPGAGDTLRGGHPLGDDE